MKDFNEMFKDMFKTILPFIIIIVILGFLFYAGLAWVVAKLLGL